MRAENSDQPLVEEMTSLDEEVLKLKDKDERIWDPFGYYLIGGVDNAYSQL